MNITLDCIPCYVRHTVEVIRQFSDNEVLQEKVVKKILSLIAELDFSQSPPEFAGVVHGIIRETLRCDDPYLEIKNNSNQLAETIVARLKAGLQDHSDKLGRSILYSIAGNIIDSGVSAITSDSEVEKSVWMAENVAPEINDLKELKIRIRDAAKIIILGDNAGEIVFDRLMLENFPKNKELFYVVKSGPILNDSTSEDAVAVGIDKYARVVANGTRTPGTPLSLVSQEFMDVFNEADLIISKGQANFETLSHLRDSRIFFLLRAKCHVIARLANVSQGSFIVSCGDRSYLEANQEF